MLTTLHLLGTFVANLFKSRRRFDISNNAAKPQLIKSIATAEGAHHVAVTKDEKLDNGDRAIAHAG